MLLLALASCNYPALEGTVKVYKNETLVDESTIKTDQVIIQPDNNSVSWWDANGELHIVKPANNYRFIIELKGEKYEPEKD